MTPIKNKNVLSSGNFEKLAGKKIPALLQTGLTRVDFQLSFQQNAGGERVLDFLGFAWLMKSFFDDKIEGASDCSFVDFIDECNIASD